MPKYRKIPIVIDAVLYDGSVKSFIEITGGATTNTKPVTLKSGDIWLNINTGKLSIYTLEGILTADVGDYIITGVHGEKYACKPDIFKRTYEPY